MGLVYADDKWKETEKNYLIKNYGILSIEEIVKKLGRSKGCIYTMAYELKINKRGISSKYKYVLWNKQQNKWIVMFRVNGKKIYFGSFVDEDEAGRVALEKAKEYGKAI